VEEIRNRLGHYGDRYYGDSYVREAIKTTAAWLLQHCDSPDGLPSRWLIDSIAQILREEATR
jgi:hemerythrin